ncbi:hypothetical protein ACIBQX_36580 [Nonomuraea sp. NPDC049714]
MTCQDGRVRHLEAIERDGRPVRVLGVLAHPTAPWVGLDPRDGSEGGRAI